MITDVKGAAHSPFLSFSQSMSPGLWLRELNILVKRNIQENFTQN